MKKKITYVEICDIFMDLHKRFGILGGYKNTKENQDIIERKWMFELRKGGWTYDGWWNELNIRLDKSIEDRKRDELNDMDRGSGE